MATKKKASVRTAPAPPRSLPATDRYGQVYEGDDGWHWVVKDRGQVDLDNPTADSPVAWSNSGAPTKADALRVGQEEAPGLEWETVGAP